MPARLPWDHEQLLRPATDPPLRARYRKLQSWYRENELHADYGTHRGKPVGSRLSEDAVDSRPALNFYSEDVLAFAEATAERVKREGGTLEVGRLRHNMLSSMPLCFNLFGSLRSEPALAQLLRTTFDIPLVEITDIRCEWAPPKALALGDRTAFDAFVTYKSEGDAKGFLAIETKYTEPFSPRVYDAQIYSKWTKSSGWFADGAAKALAPALTNQLWRNVLLATTVLASHGYDQGWAVVLTLANDEGASRARRVLDHYLSPKARVRWVTYERLLEGADGLPTISPWAEWFRKRYLDLSPLGLTAGRTDSRGVTTVE